MTRRASRIDANQHDLVHYLRALGCSVTPTHMVGNGFPDLVVGRHGKNYLFEVKDPTRPPSRRRLTRDEQLWHATWSGLAHVVLTQEDVLQALQDS